MPGILWSPFRQGNRTEYLAQYFLSALGTSAPVSRQEDIGIDFFCAVERSEGNRLTFDSPYAVQIGSTDSKSFRYGGVDKHGRWKREEIEWLFSQEIPLFFGLVDKADVTLKLYSSSPMWPCHYEFTNMGELILEPDGHWDILCESAIREPLLPQGCGNQVTYRIPLYNPIVSLTLNDLETDVLSDAKKALRIAISHEQQNLRYRSFGAPYCTWLLDVTPNKISDNRVVGMGFGASIDLDINTQLNTILPMCIALALKLRAENQIVELEHLKPIFALFPIEKVPSFVRRDFPELFR